ncbi:MAG: hypothetical protein EU532_10980 [Promethearchaeota archaeon]|nr:MAG: hypothetical protein EU532_10980 [Candidatus Lokiarchaeota archaeon]
MNYYTKQNLLDAIGDSSDLIELNFENASIVISEYGGRPLGVFPTSNCLNLLWVASDIRQAIENREWAIGGDRYWISPERDYFYKDPNNWDGWFCPEGLDPAHYKIQTKSDNACIVSSEISIKNQSTKEKFEGNITRKFSLIKEPFSTGVDYCGLEFIEDCSLNSPNLKLNGWTLATIISGGPKNPGTVLIPTKPNPKPLSYFRIIPQNRIKIGENYVGFKIDVNDIYKLAIRPEDIDYNRAAKIGYMLKIPDSQDYGFLVKLTDDIPKSQADCFDVSRDHPDSEIGVIQSYNSESPKKPLLNFGEIELQLNLFETENKISHGNATHSLFAYIGSKEEILNVIQKYLGISNPKMF